MNNPGQSGIVYCASERAIIAATAAYIETSGEHANSEALASALIAAHHADLRSDRSVCLRDAIEALERGYAPQNPSPAHPADYLTKRFQGDGHEGLEC